MTQPTLASLKTWLGLESADTYDDAVLQTSLDAALSAQAQVVTYPLDDAGRASFPVDLEDAVYIRAQRLAARRNSPEGIIGLTGGGGDFVATRVPAYDNDVLHLEGPYRNIAVA